MQYKLSDADKATHPKPKVGKAGVDARNAAFVEAYLTNGQNAKAAAAAAGYSGSQLKHTGWRILQKPEVKRQIAERARQVAELAEMNTANWAAELCAVAFANVGDLFGPDGKPIPLAQLPRHVQAALTLVKVTSDGVIECKFVDKVGALNIMARHLGLFEKDNGQQSDIVVRVELVG